MTCRSAPLLQCDSKVPPLVAGSLWVPLSAASGSDVVVGILSKEVVLVRWTHSLLWSEAFDSVLDSYEEQEF